MSLKAFFEDHTDTTRTPGNFLETNFGIGKIQIKCRSHENLPPIPRLIHESQGRFEDQTNSTRNQYFFRETYVRTGELQTNWRSRGTLLLIPALIHESQVSGSDGFYQKSGLYRGTNL